MSTATRPARIVNPQTTPQTTRQTNPGLAKPTIRSGRTSLVVAPRRAARVSSGAFVLLVSGVLGLGLLGLLALNTMLAQGSFAEQKLTQQQAALTVREQALQQEVAVLQSPDELARRASELGMVANENPVFLDLRTNKILGVAKPGQRPYVPPKAAVISPKAAVIPPKAAVIPPKAAVTPPTPAATTGPVTR